MRRICIPPKHQRNRWLLSEANESGMIPRPNERPTKRPAYPSRRIRNEASASSVMHHSSHPPTFSSTSRLSNPIVPAKMIEFRRFRAGIVVRKK